MKPLIDGDIFLYEIGSCAEYTNEEGEHVIRSFDYVVELLERRVTEICIAVNATANPIIFFTGEGNFRHEVAKKKPYKGNRQDVKKPFHHENILVYLEGEYECITAKDCEADDELAMYQVEDLEESIQYDSSMYNIDYSDTVICTRDKDLRMVPGWHYGWECGKQAEFELQWVSELGELTPVYKEDGGFKTLKGTGLSWFYAQLLMGDSTDNIPGCPGVGPKKAYSYLQHFHTEYELYVACADIYKEAYRETDKDYKEELLEQAYLLWMVRGRDENGNLVMWEPPDGRVE